VCRIVLHLLLRATFTLLLRVLKLVLVLTLVFTIHTLTLTTCTRKIVVCFMQMIATSTRRWRLSGISGGPGDGQVKPGSSHARYLYFWHLLPVFILGCN